MKQFFPDQPKSGSRRRRNLTEEEVDLWREISQHVRPIAPVGHVPKASVKPRAISPVPQDIVHDVVFRDAALVPLERRIRQKLLRGRIDVDASLDLHGLRQSEAHAALIDFLILAQRRQCRIVLIITGKGRPDPEFGSYSGESAMGVLRRALPQWLRAPDLRSVVIGFEGAGPGHGGGGAFYVRIRRSERAR